MPPTVQRWSLALVGPALIIIAVIIAMGRVVFEGVLYAGNPDIEAYFVPTYCQLGQNLSNGDLPLWNPYAFGGAAFASNPQSGWMYLPVMLLFTAFDCGAASGLLMISLPMIAGVGLYAFLRAEHMSRVAATCGGLTLAMFIAISGLATKFPFSGYLAFTTLLLAATSKCFQSGSWSGRIVWGTLAAIAWSQVAAAHISNGFIMGTGALILYVVYRAIREVRQGYLRPAKLAAVVGVFIVLFASVDLAFFLPRMSYLPRTSIGLGYDGLRDLRADLRGAPRDVDASARPEGSTVEVKLTSNVWIWRFATAPGLYMGAVALMFSLAAFTSKRHLGLAIVFAIYGLVSYLVGVRAVIVPLDATIRELPLGDFLLHASGRFSHGIPLAMGILTAAGIEAWRRSRNVVARVAMLVPGILFWGLGALIAGAHPEQMTVFFVAVGAGILVLVVAILAKRPVLLAILPLILMVESVTANHLNQQGGRRPNGLAREGEWLVGKGLPRRVIEVNAGARRDRLLRHVKEAGGGRLVSDRKLRELMIPMHYDIQEVGGYDPVMLRDYWAFVQALEPPVVGNSIRSIRLTRLPKQLVRLFGVQWYIAPRGGSVRTNEKLEPVMSTRRYTLYEIPDPEPRAALAFRWEVADDQDLARDMVIQKGFDLGTVVLERDPGIEPTDDPAIQVDFEWISMDEARLEVETEVAGLLFVRNVYDPNWRATVDGEDVAVMRADSFLQAIPVPEGKHEVRLAYEDPAVFYGIAVSVVALLFVAGAVAFLLRRERKVTTEDAEPASSDEPPAS